MDEKIDAIIAYLEEHNDIFINLIEELDGWNGYLGDARFEDMSLLFDTYTATTDFLNAIATGNDEGKRDARFDIYKPFYKWDISSLSSYSEKDYSSHLDSYFVDECNDARAHLYTIDRDPELAELFDALDEETEDANE